MPPEATRTAHTFMRSGCCSLQALAATRFADTTIDPVTAFVSTLVVFERLYSRFSARDSRLYALVLQAFTEPVGIITSVGQKLLRRWKAVQQCRCTSVITGLACAHEEADQAAVFICDSMQFGAYAALGWANQATAPPLSTKGSKPGGVL